MCNLSDIIEERGIAQGLLSIKDAAKQLNISEEEFMAKMEQIGL